MVIRTNNSSAPKSKGKLLLILALLSLGGMWWSALSKKGPVAAAANATKTVHQGVSATTGDMALVVRALPTRIEREPFEPALRDPFTAYAPSAPLQPKAKPMIKAAPPPPILNALPSAVVAPSPPPLNLRFMGQMTAPNGDRLVYAASGENTVLLTQGQKLPNGYQVTSISERQVNFTYAPLGYTTQLSLPEAPRYEIR
jgi:hypothetical protein